MVTSGGQGARRGLGRRPPRLDRVQRWVEAGLVEVGVALAWDEGGSFRRRAEQGHLGANQLMFSVPCHSSRHQAVTAYLAVFPESMRELAITFEPA